MRGLEKNCTRWRRQTHISTDGHGDSMTNLAQWGRVGENIKKIYIYIYIILATKRKKSQHLDKLERRSIELNKIQKFQKKYSKIRKKLMLSPSFTICLNYLFWSKVSLPHCFRIQGGEVVAQPVLQTDEQTNNHASYIRCCKLNAPKTKQLN